MRRSIVCPVKAGAAGFPRRVAVSDPARELTYEELDQLADSAVNRIAGYGIGEGDVVAVIGHNSVVYAILFLAALRSGFVLMPLNWRLNEAELSRQAHRADCRLVVHDGQFLSFVRNTEFTAVTFAALENPGTGVQDPVAGETTLPLDRDGLILFTSGSRGNPRGVVLSWSSLYHSAAGALTAIDPRPGDCWLAALPFYHVGGLSILFRMFFAGGSVKILPRYSPQNLYGQINATRVDYISLVPTMLVDLLDLGETHRDLTDNLRRLRAIVLGGAPAGKSLMERAAGLRLPVKTTYGLTETASMVTLLDWEGVPAKLHTSGKPLPGSEIKIAGDGDAPLPAGSTGRIMVRGRTLFSRYLDKTGPAVSPAGWFDTGDNGEFDEDGYLVVHGRKDRVVVSGGENIDLGRIEAAIAALPGIRFTQVLSRPDRRWGLRPVAFVVPAEARPGENVPIDESSLKAQLKGSLPGLMIPDRIVLVEEMPLTGSGKYDHEELRRRFAGLFGGQ
jgi:o-succinylbenzoate---CoA ligase